MSNLRELLADCRARGVRFIVGDQGEMTVDAPRGVLSPVLVGRLKEHKAALQAMLTEGTITGAPVEIAAAVASGLPIGSDDVGGAARGEVVPESSAPAEPAPEFAPQLDEEFAPEFERPGWGPDGWPVDTVAPLPPCPRCGGRDAWQTLVGNWRCLSCEPMTTAQRVLDQAARLRARHATRPAGERGRVETARRSQDARSPPASV